MTKFEKRVAAWVMAAIIGVSGVQNALLPVYAQETGQQAAVEESMQENEASDSEQLPNEAKEEAEKNDVPDGQMIPIAESIQVNQPVQEETSDAAAEAEEVQTAVQSDETEIVNVQEGETYTTKEGQSVEYYFTTSENGTYGFVTRDGARFSVFDENGYSVNSLSGKKKGKYSFEEGKTYCIKVYGDNESVNWKLERVETVNVQEGKTYTTKIDYLVEYYFTPLETGKYVFYGDWVYVYDEELKVSGESFGNGQIYSFEEGKTYYVYPRVFVDDESESWSVKKTETVNIQEGEDYTTRADQSVEYCFIPSETEDYRLVATDGANFYIYDEELNLLYHGKNGQIYSFEEGRTYRIAVQVYGDNESVDWGLEKGETVNIQEGKTYTTKADQLVGYYFTPSETGKYQLVTTDLASFDVYDEEQNRVSSDGSKYSFEKGRTYRIAVWGYGDNESVEWSLEKVESVNVREGETYTTKADQLVEYYFTPSETGRYKFLRRGGPSWFSVFNQEQQPVYAYGDSIYPFEEGKTYRIDVFVNDAYNESVDWSVKKTETVNIQEGKDYTTRAEQLVEYYFIPSETGRYRFTKTDVADFLVFNEEREQIHGTMRETYSFEEGKTYYITVQVYGDNESVDWSMKKTETVNIQEGKDYTTRADQSVEYYFTPSETGKYQLVTTDLASFSVYDEEQNWVSSDWSKYSFEKGKTYRIDVSVYGDVDSADWSLKKTETVNIQEGKDYTTRADQSIEYYFTPLETGKYKLFLSGGNVSVYDEEQNWIILDFRKKCFLEEGKTYRIDVSVYGDADSADWSVKKVKEIAVEENHAYTTVNDDGMTEYTFSPSESGRYQFNFSEKPYLTIYDESGQVVGNVNELHKSLYLEKDVKYQMLFSLLWNESKVDWSVSKKKTMDIEAQKEYVTTAGEAVDYRFVPQKTGWYVLASNNAEDVAIYDAHWDFVNYECISEENEMKMLLKEGETYYFSIVAKGVSCSWSLEEIQESGQYGYRIKKDNTVEIIAYLGNDATLSLPEKIEGKTVTGIGGGVFENNKVLKNVTVPATVTEIQYMSFGMCENLQTVKFASGSQLKTIGNKAFYSSRNLSSITIPEGVQKLGEESFLGLGVIEIDVPDSVTEVGNSVFRSCNQLERVSLGKGVSEIAESMFRDCRNLRQVDLAQDGNLKVIDDIAFLQCKNLGSITIPNGVQRLGKLAFLGSGLKAIKIPDSVTEVGEKIFLNCSELEKVELGSGLSTLSEFMFKNCTKLTQFHFSGEVTGTDCVTKIEYGALQGCSALEDIQMPDSLEAMEGGQSLRDVPWYENQEDGTVYAGKVLYRQKGKLEADTEITVKAGTKGIASYAFEGQSGLKSVKLPNGLTNIGGYAFVGCDSMKSVTIPRSVTEIGEHAFDKRVEGFTIYGAPRSAAQKYAEENGFTFVPIATVMKGDVDGNELVDSEDLRIVLRAVCGKVELTEEQKEAADVENEGDGVDTQDMRKILKFVCGKITEL